MRVCLFLLPLIFLEGKGGKCGWFLNWDSSSMQAYERRIPVILVRLCLSGNVINQSHCLSQTLAFYRLSQVVRNIILGTLYPFLSMSKLPSRLHFEGEGKREKGEGTAEKSRKQLMREEDI